MSRRRPALAGVCRHCGQPVEECPAVILWGHRHSAAACRGWAHSGGEHACAGGGVTVAEPAPA